MAVFPFLHSKNCPDIGRCGQGKDQTGKQNCRSCPFKLSVLSVIKICGSQLCKKNTARIKSIAGNTTLFTTVLICAEASFHVPSIAPATSHVPAAHTVVPNIREHTSTSITITNHFFSSFLFLSPRCRKTARKQSFSACF